jgi:hypothetical protein
MRVWAISSTPRKSEFHHTLKIQHWLLKKVPQKQTSDYSTRYRSSVESAQNFLELLLTYQVKNLTVMQENHGTNTQIGRCTTLSENDDTTVAMGVASGSENIAIP